MVTSICGCEDGGVGMLRGAAVTKKKVIFVDTHMRPSSEHETMREPSLLKCTAVT
jgi:hypothetical protein